MKKSLYIIFIGIVLGCFPSNAQKPAIHISFDKDSGYYKKKEIPEIPGSILDGQQRSFSEGIKGKALDLSKNAALRMPIQLFENSTPKFDINVSFSVQVWIKTLPNAQMGTPIIGNKENKNKQSTGWLITSREDGGWELLLSDGKNNYKYHPTVKRQKINDGEWHQLTFTVNREKDEIWIYIDGENVAIYNIPGLRGLNSKWATTIGGFASQWDYLGQGFAFNGYLDEIKIWKRVISSNQVNEAYQKFFPSIKREDFLKSEIKVMSWNIWDGGRRFGNQVNLERVIEMIKASNADVVTLIETYESGEIIADALGYHFYLISTNLSIMSRYPIKETIKAFNPFNFGGVILQITNEQELVVFDTWLHYLPDYRGNILKGKMTADELVKDEDKTRLKEIKNILKEIKPYITNADQIPVIMAGDFNSNSHMDWIEETRDVHLGYVVEWPVTLAMERAGFVDSFREIKPNPVIDPGFSGWQFNRVTKEKDEKSRIDYIFYKGKSLRALDSKVIDYHPIMFPSDHATFSTVFQLKD